jgi:CcmD family protein
MSAFEFNQYFIIGAYAVTWLVLLGYLVHLVRRGGRVRADHERIRHLSGGAES